MTDTEIAIQWLKENLPSLEDYGEMIGAPPQYCGIKYVYNDPCGYVFETAIEVLEEKLEREKGCEYCDFSSGEVGATINTSGDDFVMIADDKDKSITLATDDEHFKLLKINYCPMCGRKLNNSTAD